MKSKLFIITIVTLLALGAGTFYVLGRDESNKNTAMNNDTNSTANSLEEEVDVRKSVWSQLPQEQQERINGTWQDGKVSKITLREDAIMSDGDKIVGVGAYAGKEVYLIDFPTKTKAIPNNMVVYADITTLEIIGYGLVD